MSNPEHAKQLAIMQSALLANVLELRKQKTKSARKILQAYEAIEAEVIRVYGENFDKGLLVNYASNLFEHLGEFASQDIEQITDATVTAIPSSVKFLGVNGETDPDHRRLNPPTSRGPKSFSPNIEAANKVKALMRENHKMKQRDAITKVWKGYSVLEQSNWWGSLIEFRKAVNRILRNGH